MEAKQSFEAIDLYPVAPDISAMVAARTIMAALIAISVAMVPVVGGVGHFDKARRNVDGRSSGYALLRSR
jgi:hypothetical protein